MPLASRDSLIVFTKAIKMNWLFFYMWDAPMEFCSGAKRN